MSKTKQTIHTFTQTMEASSKNSASASPAHSFPVASQQLSKERTGRKRAELLTRTLFKISNAINTTKDLQDLYKNIHLILGEVIDLTNFFIAIYDKDQGRVSFPYFVDQYDSGYVYEDQINLDNSLTGTVIKKASPVFFTQKDLKKRAGSNKVIGTIPLIWIAVPLMIKEEVIGIMSTQSYHDPNLFDDIDLNTLTSISDQVALAIERKRNEQALINSEKKYRTILSTIADGYFETDKLWRFRLTNKAMGNILDTESKQLIGKNCLHYLEKKELKRIKKKNGNLFVNPEHNITLEIKVKDEKGKIRYLEAILTSILDNRTRTPIGIRGLVRNITERKTAELNQKILEEQLQQSQRLESLGTLAGGIAHDFNNLLMGIQGRVDLLQNNLAEDHPHLKGLNQIEKFVDRAANLTSRLLGFARGGKYELKPADLNELIKESINIFGRAKKEVTIDTTLQDTISSVEVDANQIEQVCINLLVNAWQAMDQAGSISISTSEKEVDFNTARFHAIPPGKYVQMTIDDTGKGIEPENIARIFDPFFTTKSLGSGTGLGLAMVYGIIKNHAGAIFVESQLNKGSRFTVLLPASAKQTERKEKKKGTTSKGSGQILLVDDEIMITEVGREMLSLIGYNVITACSGMEALEKYKQHQETIDLVILDMIMPGMSGGELFDKLKELQPEVIVILSSGYSMEGAAQKIMERGCQGFIQKPFNISQLSEKLREVLPVQS